ncbi:nucleotide binding domain containing protein [Perkinsus sp. BL_2016]|nr:nucleotide binding domain containing protein [Perkinsus sp. BL_2016]
MGERRPRSRVLMWVYLIVYVLSGTGTNLAMRLLLNKMQNYQFFVVQSACCMYIPFTASFLIVDAMRKRLRPRVILNREVNKRFLFMAFLDCLANYMVISGAAHTNLAFQTLIPQAVIPVSMILGALVLGSTFSNWQIAGAAVVMAGVAIVCLPTMLSGATGSVSGRWTLMLFLSNIPLSLSALVKELVLHHRSRDVPVSYLNTAVSFLQFLIGFILAPFGLGGVSPGQLSSQLRDGYHCLMGTSAACPGGSLYEYILFCLLMFSMNISLLFVVRHGSSSIMYAASALVLPLSNLANTSRLFMGTAAAPLDDFTLYGIVPILVGILLYANAKPTKEAGQHPAGLPVTYPEADNSSLGKGLVEPGESFYPISRAPSIDITLFDLDALIPPRGVVGGIGIPPWMPIQEEKSLLARWSVTAHVRGDLVSPLLRQGRRRHSSPPSPLADEIARSPSARGHGIWIPGAGKEGEGNAGFFEWGMQVEAGRHRS